MRAIGAAAALLLVTGCGSAAPQPGDGPGGTAAMDAAAAVAPAAPPAAPGAPGGAAAADQSVATPAAVPKIAYAYALAFRLPDNRVAALQEAHVAACDQLGPANCQVIDLKRTTSEGDYVSATLKLRVAAPLARALSQRLERSAGPAGGTLASSAVDSEDLSKQMVDTEARIRAKEALIARLTEILRTKTGNVAQLIEAERSISAAQEELDAARSWLVEASTRVATSTIDVSYQSTESEGRRVLDAGAASVRLARRHLLGRAGDARAAGRRRAAVGGADRAGDLGGQGCAQALRAR